ncbi:MAG: C25 family cysteine peptidase, partial [Bacteroidota bacterium]
MEKRANFVAGVVLSALMLLVPVFSYAQNWTVIDPNSPVNSTIDLVYSDQAMSLVQFRLNAYSITPVNTGNGTAYVVEAPDCTPILESGAPDLPKYTQSIIIPDQGGSSLQITSSAYIELNNIDIAPSKGNLTRDIDPASVPYMYGKLYSVDGFFPVNSGMLKEPYILRDFRGQTLVLHPFQYNPVTKTLRIYTEIKAMISYNNNSGINELTRIKSPEINDDFGHIYARHFLNYESAKTKYTALSEGAPGNMLIICYDNYLSAMQPFVDWKRRKGIETEIVGVSTVGTTSSAIKTYVANYYNTNGLVYLLIVGDDPQVTSSSTSAGDSDVDYGYIAGSDHYAEIFVGRFSAQTIAEVQTQVSRTIEYEKTPVIGDWWTNAIGIGSDQGPGDDNEMDYEHIRNIMTDLLGFTYSNDFEFYDGSQGGNDASGNPTPSMVGTAVNGGASTIFYCGHGSDDQFVTSGFSSTDVNNLTNNNKYPFIISVACVNGNFQNITCFAEAWLRATDNGEPTGAIAFLGSTINQSWNPPME